MLKSLVADCQTLLSYPIWSYLSYLHDQRSSVIELTRKYPGLFHDVPSQTTVVSHDIDVGECPPIKQHPYRVNPHKRQLMKNEVDYCG